MTAAPRPRRADLARLPSWPAAVLVVLVAVLTLALRIVALSVALAADATDRAAGLASAADEALTAPLGDRTAGFGAGRGRHRVGGDPVTAAEVVEVAARVAARAVRTGRTPPLGSVRHGTEAAALAGCPCVRCDRLRADLVAEPAGQAGPEAAEVATAGPRPSGPYFGLGHLLVDAARARCRRVHDGGPRPGGLVGGVACGRCWEASIRADERLAVEFGLPAEPPGPDRFAVDEVAVERAGYGDRVKLTAADRAELARRVDAGRVGWAEVARAGVSGTALRAAGGAR